MDLNALTAKILFKQLSPPKIKMNKHIIALFLLTIGLAFNISAQIPVKTLISIVKAEDERRFDATLGNLLKSPNAKIRQRAALAAGRIGDDAAIPVLTKLLKEEMSVEVSKTAAFALGEIESVKAADVILEIFRNAEVNEQVRARTIEAAGKIVAANSKDEKAKELGRAILSNLESEAGRGKTFNREVVLVALTAVLRARPDGGDVVAAKFLTSPDARIRIDAANTLTRIRAKNANETLRKMLKSDTDAVARANAARALGAAEDKDALDILTEAAVSDADSRVRVSAIRAVGGLKDKSSAEKLLTRGEFIFSNIKTSPDKKNNSGFPVEKSELLEIAIAVSRLLPNSENRRAAAFLSNLRQIDKTTSPETEIAFARIAPKIFVDSVSEFGAGIFAEDWRTASAVFQGLGEIANLEANEETNLIKSRTRVLLVQLISGWLTAETKPDEKRNLAIPDLLRAFAAFKSENTSGIMRPILDGEKNVFIRAAIAEILGEQPASKENIEALKKTFEKSLESDKNDNDAQLATLSALVKSGKSESEDSLRLALTQTDFLLRRHAANLIKENDLTNTFPNIEKYIGTVKHYNPKTKTKLGQILNANADYLRAVSRKNDSVRAVLTTDKGAFTIEFAPEDAPLTVDNFIKLARTNYFNGLAVHRVVPNFVMQDGDPRGDGNGGPGWSIRCEINLLEYERGAVGMALSGKDTGGSQWFVTHSPQPHLDGGYTIFGRVNETDMKIVDSIVRGDKILSVKIIEGKQRQKFAR